MRQQASHPTVRDPLPRVGKRVSLRRLAPSDLAPFQAYRQDKELGAYQGWNAQSDQEASRFIEEMARAPLFQPGQWIQLAVEHGSTGSMIGDIGVFISDDHQHAEIGFTLNRQFQGLGLATEAVQLALDLIFEQAVVSQTVAVTDARNHASIRLLERLGMRRQKTVSSLFKGQPCEEHFFTVSRQDVG